MNLFISSCFSLLLVFVINVLCYQEESDGYHYQKAYPQDVMVDVINNFGIQLLKAHNEGNNNNMALSPYGATSVLIALGEGVRGYAVEEIQHAVHIPQDISVVRIGLRDIHRHLKSYFIPKEGFLAGLTLSNEKVPLNEEYKEILRFYGFDLDSFNNPLYPDINEVTTAGMVFMGNTTEDVMSTTSFTSTFLPTETATITEEEVTIAPSTIAITSTAPESTIRPEGTTQEGTTTEKSTTKVYTRSTDAVSKDEVEDEVSTLPISTQSSIETTSALIMTSEESIMKESTDSPTTIQATTQGPSSSISTTEEATTSKVTKESTDSPTTIQPTTQGPSSSISTTEEVTTSKVMKESTVSPKTIQPTTQGASSSISTTEEVTTSKVMKESTTTTELASTSFPEKDVETTSIKLTTIQATTGSPSTSISTTEEITTSKVTTTEIISSIGTDTTTTSSIPSTTEEMEDMSTTSSESSSEEDNVIITTSVTQSVTKVTTEYQTSTIENDKVTSTVQTTELEDVTKDDDSSDLIAISTETTSNEVVDFSTSTITPDTTTIASTETPENTTVASSKRKRTSRSVIDYIIARYYDNQLIGNPKINYEPNESLSFLMYGKIKEPNINFMTYDAVLPIAYIPLLNSVALSFPLDSKEYYLLLILPVEETGIDRLIHDMSHTTSLRDVITALRYAHVRAVIPSFMLKGYVILTPTLQKLGIQRIFEPRQTDFSLMTREKDVYVTNVEQAVTVTIRNYVEPDNLPNYRNLQRTPPVEFKADHPFLYFVMDTEIHVTLMAGKIVNPLNSRIR